VAAAAALSPAPGAYTIRPLALLFHGGALYLQAQLDADGSYRRFCVHRVTGRVPSIRTFTPPRDLKREMSTAFGVFVSEVAEDVGVLFSAEIAWRIEDSSWRTSENGGPHGFGPFYRGTMGRSVGFFSEVPPMEYLASAGL
jgi:hypothetical protein